MAEWLTSVESEHFNGFYNYQALWDDPDVALPDGWKRVEHPRGAFYTNSRETEENVPYSYPLPYISQGAQPALPLHLSVLTCTAPIAMLSFGTKDKRNNVETQQLFIFHQGKRVGCLDAMEEYVSDASEWQQDNIACELVALSEADVPTDFGEYVVYGYSAEEARKTRLTINILTRGDSATSVSIYNVLWIKWADKIAYRLGTGYVSKELWDALEPVVRSFKLN